MKDSHLSDIKYARMSRHMSELLRKADEGAVEFEWTMSSLLMLINGRRLVLPKDARKVPKTKDSPRDIISVPDLSRAELYQLAKARIGVTSYDEAFENWDFYANQPTMLKKIAGKKYDVLTWHPKPVSERVETKRDRKYKTDDEVRELFEELGVEGNTAAFVTWLMDMKKIPMGCYATIPPQGKIPCFYCNEDGGRGFYFKDACNENVWSYDDGWTLVAFREVPP